MSVTPLWSSTTSSKACTDCTKRARKTLLQIPVHLCRDLKTTKDGIKLFSQLPQRFAELSVMHWLGQIYYLKFNYISMWPKTNFKLKYIAVGSKVLLWTELYTNLIKIYSYKLSCIATMTKQHHSAFNYRSPSHLTPKREWHILLRIWTKFSKVFYKQNLAV